MRGLFLKRSDETKERNKMKISKRKKNGWVKELVENQDKERCDKCGQRLWVNPCGGIYCNTDNGGVEGERANIRQFGKLVV